MPRASEFSQEVADLICERIAEGESLRKICQSEDMPNKATVFRWLVVNDAFRDQYAHAREAQADSLADEILDIADDGQSDTFIDENGNERTNQEVLGRSKLRVDARKWLASKMAPKKYSDRMQIDANVRRDAADMTDDELLAIARGSSAGTS